MGNSKLIAAGLVVFGLGAALSVTSFSVLASRACVSGNCSGVPVLPTFFGGVLLAASGGYVAVIGLHRGDLRLEHLKLFVVGLALFALGASVVMASFLLFGNQACLGTMPVSCSNVPDLPTLLGGLLLVAGGACVAGIGLYRGGRETMTQSELSKS